MLLNTADKLLLDAQLSPVQQRALVAWLTAAEPLPGERDLADRAAGLFAEVGRLSPVR